MLRQGSFVCSDYVKRVNTGLAFSFTAAKNGEAVMSGIAFLFFSMDIAGSNVRFNAVVTKVGTVFYMGCIYYHC